MINKIAVASSNQHKIQEIANMLTDLPVDVFSVSALGKLPEVIEDADTFSGNAIKKARAFARHYNTFVIADDSGLEVEALNNQPGVYSARFAGTDCTDAENIARVITDLHKQNKTTSPAAFHCVIAAFAPDWTEAKCFPGHCSGSVIDTPRGSTGFGYDPIFIPTNNTLTFAEIGPHEKNRLSHRHHALLKFKEYITHEIIQSD